MESMAVTLQEVAESRLPTTLKPFPREIPHSADWLRNQYPERRRIHTTLDAGTQRIALKALARVKGEREREGVFNASVVVVDHQSDEIKALIGSFDYWDPDHGGQIIAFDNPRSPGSTLKPFIYASSIDKGQVLPGFLVPDIPAVYGTYAPKNYDGRFTGLVSYQESLSLSLNLPFIWALRGIGVENFIGSMRTMGAEHLNPDPGHYGLSLAAGGVELTAIELAGFYATLARGGVYRPLAWTREDREEAVDLRIFSEGASYLTTQTLQLKDRPDFPARWEFSAAPRDIAWKTGTSFGHRDAWAVGYGRQYTAVVWMGNVDNSPSSNLVGSVSSGPILFDVLEGIEERGRQLVDDRVQPDDLVSVEVCAYSGRLVTDACPHSKQALASVSSVPTEPCPYHRRVEVELASGLAVTPGCRGDKITEFRSVLAWPASVRRWLKDQHRHLPQSPAFAPDCKQAAVKEAPQILSPVAGQITLLIPGMPTSDQEIPLEADVPDGSSELSWFLNGQYLGTIAADDRLWWTPELGDHEVLVVDSQGTSGRRRFSVRRREVVQARY
jgi:penicillin-binding protein 1C